MKKLLPILLGAVLVLLGCQQPMIPIQPITVEALINGSKEEVDLTGVICNEDVTVTKAVKIKNGDFNGKTLTVNVSGVTLENAKKVNVVVAEAVGDGDFTVTASDITSFKVLGGGANSIHVKDTKVSEILVAKENVRVSLEGKSNITKLKVKKGITAKLEVNSSEVKIDAAEVVAEDGSKLDGESVTLTVAEGVNFTAPEGSKAETASAAGGSDKTEFTLRFDDSKIEVLKNGSVYLKNGDKVNKGDSLFILVTSIETGKVVDKIVISGKDFDSEIPDVGYYYIESLDSTLANESVIEISYKERDPKEYTLTFSEGITCSNSRNNITSGSTVYEGDSLIFSVSPAAGQIVDKWYVNGTELGSNSGSNLCVVTLRALNISGNTVNVTYTPRDKKVYTVTFGEGITCRNSDDNQSIPSGSTVNEGTDIIFNATPAAGEVVDKWYVNGTEQNVSSGSNSCFVTLKAFKISENTVNVTYTTRAAATYTLTFGNDIKCHNDNPLTGEEIESGSTVYEGQTLWFTATPPSGQVVDKWFINGTEQNSPAGLSNYGVILQSSQITGNKVNVTVTYKQQ